MSEVVKPFRTKEGVYLLHPEFIGGLISQISWQCRNPNTGEGDIEAGKSLLEKAICLFSLEVQSDVIRRGGSLDEAGLQAQEMFACFDATLFGIQ